MDLGGVLIKRGDRSFYLSPEAAQAIRELARPALTQGRCGLLFGINRKPDTARISEVRPLEPDTEASQSLDALSRFARLFQDPPVDGAEEPLLPLGWYSVRPVGKAVLTELDVQFHNTLFSKEQIALMCERSANGDIKFLAGRPEARFAVAGPRAPLTQKSNWTMRGAIAAGVATLMLGGGLLLRRNSSGTEADKPAAVCKGSDTATLQRHVEILEGELSAELARSRRLEETLRILRDRNTVSSLSR